MLPELIGGNAEPAHYKKSIRKIATDNRCYVIGGSCYISTPDGRVNSGIVVDSEGSVVCGYDKIRPYGSENQSGVAGGSNIGQFELAGRVVTVLICSDLWFSDTFATLGNESDILLIPSFSITQRGDPRKARDLWKHMIVSRAYEYAAYVGVCDWAHPCEFDGLLAAGVSGFADPRPNSEEYFAGNFGQKVQSYELDFERLDSFRENRANRGFSSRSR
ncbi:MAG: carbon-nitrogen hydrolase family protein [Pseudomonadales bacterium]